MARGEQALNANDPGEKPGSISVSAIALRPDDAKAQGRYAYTEAQRADNGGSAGDVPEGIRTMRSAAALAINPNEPHAHLARLI